MDVMAIIRIAMRALARNKMRSTLTMLGIIIGVAAVIAMVVLDQGAQQQVQQRIAAMGSNLLYVGAGTVNKGGVHLGLTLTKDKVALVGGGAWFEGCEDGGAQVIVRIPVRSTD